MSDRLRKSRMIRLKRLLSKHKSPWRAWHELFRNQNQTIKRKNETPSRYLRWYTRTSRPLWWCQGGVVVSKKNTKKNTLSRRNSDVQCLLRYAGYSSRGAGCALDSDNTYIVHMAQEWLVENFHDHVTRQQTCGYLSSFFILIPGTTKRPAKAQETYFFTKYLCFSWYYNLFSNYLMHRHIYMCVCV